MAGEPRLSTNKVTMVLVRDQRLPCVQLLLALGAAVGPVRGEVLALEMVLSRIRIPHCLAANLAEVAAGPVDVLAQVGRGKVL